MNNINEDKSRYKSYMDKYKLPKLKIPEYGKKKRSCIMDPLF